MSTFSLGIEAKLYYGTANTNPTTEMESIRDLSIDMDSQTTSMPTRGGGGWDSTRTALRSLGFSGTMAWDSTAHDCKAFKNAYLLGTILALKALDSTSKGPVGDFVITKFGLNEPLTEGLEISWEAKCNTTSRVPTWPD